MKKLAPILKYSLENRERMGLYSFYCRESRLITREGVENQEFPKEFVSRCQEWEDNHLLRQCISYIELSGSGCNADGKYEKQFDRFEDEWCMPTNDERTTGWGGHQVTFNVQYWREGGDDDYLGWAIVSVFQPMLDDEEPDLDARERKKCWIAPCSQNHRRPPLKGWIPADPLARGNPTIKYILRECIE